MSEWWIALAFSEQVEFVMAIVTAIAMMVALLTFWQMRKDSFEQSRAYIAMYVDVEFSSVRSSELYIKNFGNTAGRIVSICCSPSLTTLQPKRFSNIPEVDEKRFAGLTLVPGQFVHTVLDLPDSVAEVKFDVTINYETMGKIFSETSTIDLSYCGTIAHRGKSNSFEQKTISELNNIAESIREFAAQQSPAADEPLLPRYDVLPEEISKVE